MPFELTASISEELWQQAEEQGQVDWLDTETDIIDWATLPHVGKFWQCVMPLEKSFRITIQEWEVAENIFHPGYEVEDGTEIGLIFNLSGQVQTHHHGLTGEIAEIVGYYQFENSRLPETELWTAGTPFRRIYLNFEPLQLFGDLNSQQITQLPIELRHLLEENNYPFYKSQLITPEIHQILQQILYCPHEGFFKQMYLKGKAWELLTLCFQSLLGEKSESRQKLLEPSEVEKIHHAKEILISQLNNPPSLLDLAQQANLNDFSLKQGFKQVFGTTVFKYLHEHRLEIARQLLINSDLNIQTIARQVGFAHRSYFAQAFCKKFGLNPQKYRQRLINSL
ncbi:MAG: helix-turn-helix transcriptional regulator [Waterburya sp.]